jgi:hypothetical protein
MLVQQMNETRPTVVNFLSVPALAPRVAGDWRARAADAYRQNEIPEAMVLRAELSARLLALTGRTVTGASVWVDQKSRVAVGVLDGTVFRLRQGNLTVVRPCAHCATGEYESPTIVSLADLGYALNGWEPRCPHCELEDSAEDYAAW